MEKQRHQKVPKIKVHLQSKKRGLIGLKILAKFQKTNSISPLKWFTLETYALASNIYF